MMGLGFLRHDKPRRRWIIDVARFPLVDDRPQQDVTRRLEEAILKDGIPATRDIMLVSIAEACGLRPRGRAPGRPPKPHSNAERAGDH